MTDHGGVGRGVRGAIGSRGAVGDSSTSSSGGSDGVRRGPPPRLQRHGASDDDAVLTFDNAAFAATPTVEGKTQRVLQWLVGVNENMARVPPAVLLRHQPRIEAQLFALLKSPAPRPFEALRAQIARAFCLLYTHGNPKTLFDTMSQLQNMLGAKKLDDGDATLACIHTLGALTAVHGAKLMSLYPETMQLFHKAWRGAKESDVPLKVEALSAAARSVRSGAPAVNDAIAKDYAKIAARSMTDRVMLLRTVGAALLTSLLRDIPSMAPTTPAEYDAMLQLAIRSLDGATMAHRQGVAALISQLLTLSQTTLVRPPPARRGAGYHPGSDRGGSAVGSAQATPAASGPPELQPCLSVQDAVLMVVGPCQRAASRDVQVGLVQGLGAFFRYMGPTWVEAHGATLIPCVLELLLPKTPFASLNDELLHRALADFLLQHVISQLLSESAQRETIQTLKTTWLSLAHVAENRSAVLTSVLMLMATLLQDLELAAGVAASQDPTKDDGLAERLMACVTSPSRSVNAAVCVALQSLCRARPFELTRMLETLLSMICQEANGIGSESKLLALGRALASCLAVFEPCILYTSYDVAADVMRTATAFVSGKERLVSTGSPVPAAAALAASPAAATSKTQATVRCGWLLIAGLMTLPAPFVAVHLPRLMPLWKATFTQTDVSSKMSEHDWIRDMSRRYHSLAALQRLLHRHGDSVLMAPAVVQRIVHCLTALLAYLSALPAAFPVYAVASDEGLTLGQLESLTRKRLFQCFQLVAPAHYTPAHPALLAATLEMVCPDMDRSMDKVYGTPIMPFDRAIAADLRLLNPFVDGALVSVADHDHGDAKQAALRPLVVHDADTDALESLLRRHLLPAPEYDVDAVVFRSGALHSPGVSPAMPRTSASREGTHADGAHAVSPRPGAGGPGGGGGAVSRAGSNTDLVGPAMGPAARERERLRPRQSAGAAAADAPPPPLQASIGSALELYALLFVYAAEPVQAVQAAALERFLTPHARLAAGWKISLHVNVLTVAIGILKEAVHHRRAHVRVGAAAAEVFQRMALQGLVAEVEPVRMASAEMVGRLAAACGPVATDALLTTVIDLIMQNADPAVRSGACIALGLVCAYVGVIAVGSHLPNVVSILHGLTTDPNVTVHAWAFGALWLVMSNAGLMFEPYLASTIDVMTRVLASEAHQRTHVAVKGDNATVYPTLGRVLNALVGVIGPELNAQPHMRDFCFAIYGILKTSDNPFIVVEAIHCIGHFILFSKEWVHGQALIPFLQSHITARATGIHVHITRKAAVACLYQLSRRDPLAVSQTASGREIEEQIMALLDVETDPGVRSEIRDIMFVLVAATAAHWPSRWIALAQAILFRGAHAGARQPRPGSGSMTSSAASHANGVAGVASNGAHPTGALRHRHGALSADDAATPTTAPYDDLNAPADGSGDGALDGGRRGHGAADDEDDDGYGLAMPMPSHPPRPAAAGSGGAGGASATAGGRKKPDPTSRWRTHVLAIELLIAVIDAAFASGDAACVHLATARAAERAGRGTDFLVLQLGDLVKLAFTAATSTIDMVRMEGLTLLQRLMDGFAHVEDSDVGGQMILVQYQAQISASLVPGFQADNSPLVVSAACRASVPYLASSMTRDVVALSRIIRPLSVLLTASRPGAAGAVGAAAALGPRSPSHAELVLHASVLTAWAQLLAASHQSQQTHLQKVVLPEVPSLLDQWLRFLVAHIENRALLMPPSPRHETRSGKPAAAPPPAVPSDRHFAARQAIIYPYYDQSWPIILEATTLALEQLAVDQVDHVLRGVFPDARPSATTPSTDGADPAPVHPPPATVADDPALQLVFLFTHDQLIAAFTAAGSVMPGLAASGNAAATAGAVSASSATTLTPTGLAAAPSAAAAAAATAVGPWASFHRLFDIWTRLLRPAILSHDLVLVRLLPDVLNLLAAMMQGHDAAVQEAALRAFSQFLERYPCADRLRALVASDLFRPGRPIAQGLQNVSLALLRLTMQQSQPPLPSSGAETPTAPSAAAATGAVDRHALYAALLAWTLATAATPFAQPFTTRVLAFYTAMLTSAAHTAHLPFVMVNLRKMALAAWTPTTPGAAGLLERCDALERVLVGQARALAAAAGGAAGPAAAVLLAAAILAASCADRLSAEAWRMLLDAVEARLRSGRDDVVTATLPMCRALLALRHDRSGLRVPPSGADAAAAAGDGGADAAGQDAASRARRRIGHGIAVRLLPVLIDVFLTQDLNPALTEDLIKLIIVLPSRLLPTASSADAAAADDGPSVTLLSSMLQPLAPAGPRPRQYLLGKRLVQLAKEQGPELKRVVSLLGAGPRRDLEGLLTWVLSGRPCPPGTPSP